MSTATPRRPDGAPPLAVALLCIVVAPLRRSGRLAAALSVLAASTSLAASVALLKQTLEGAPGILLQWPWLVSDGQTVATVGMQLDGVSIPMLVVVSFVATAVQIFSLSYMDDETPASYGRYFTWHALFLFSMQGLVLAPNLLQLFAAWEPRRTLQLPAHRLLLPQEHGRKGLSQGLLDHQAGRHGPALGPHPPLRRRRNLHVGPRVRPSPGHGAALGRGPLLLRGDGQVRAVSSACLAPRRHGGTHPRLPALLHAATMVAAGVYLLVRAQPIFLGSEVVLHGGHRRLPQRSSPPSSPSHRPTSRRSWPTALAPSSGTWSRRWARAA